MNPNKIPAPNISPKELWAMDDVRFNQWRRENDFPRIITFFKSSLNQFELWLKENNLSDEDLIKHGPGIFLKPEKELFIYTTEKNEETIEHIETKRYKIGDVIFHLKKVIGVRKFTPYLQWIKQRNIFPHERTIPYMNVSAKVYGKTYFISELELLNVGNYSLPNNYFISRRLLEFCSIDNLHLKYTSSNAWLKLWFCSAYNLNIEGDLPFLDAYNTDFGSFYNRTQSGIKFKNGTYQDWKFENCELTGKITDSFLKNWRLLNTSFDVILSATDIIDSDFQYKTSYKISNQRAHELYSKVSKALLSIGKRKEAGKYIYKEKKYLRRMHLYPSACFYNEFIKIVQEGRYKKASFYTKHYMKYIYSKFQDIFWGYGYKPLKIVFNSILLVLLFSFFYFFSNCSGSFENFSESLLQSIYAFTTLGVINNLQNELVVRLALGVEGLLGLIFMGFLIAGYVNKFINN